MAAITNTAPTRIVGGSAANKLSPDNVYVKVLDILKNGDVGSLRNMFAKYTINGGKAVFKTPERLIPAFYTATGGNKSQYGVVTQVEIDIDKADQIKHPIETLDFATQVLAAEEEARIATSISTAIDSRLDAEFLQGLIDASVGNIAYMAGAKDHYVTEEATEADVAAVWRKISFQANALKGLVTKNTVGVDNGQLLVLVSNNVLTLLAEHLKVYTDKNTQVFVEGSETQGFRIGNITVLAHVFLGQTFPAGSLHESEAYDFKGKEVLLIHSEAFAAVFNQQPTFWNAVDPDNGNMVLGVKYQFGSGVLRPAFIKEISMYKDAATAGAAIATGTGEIISADIATTKPDTK